MPGSFAVTSAYCQLSLYQNDFQKKPLLKAALPTISSCKKMRAEPNEKRMWYPASEEFSQRRKQRLNINKTRIKTVGKTHSLLAKQKEV